MPNTELYQQMIRERDETIASLKASVGGADEEGES